MGCVKCIKANTFSKKQHPELGFLTPIQEVGKGQMSYGSNGTLLPITNHKTIINNNDNENKLHCLLCRPQRKITLMAPGYNTNSLKIYSWAYNTNMNLMPNPWGKVATLQPYDFLPIQTITPLIQYHLVISLVSNSFHPHDLNTNLLLH